MPNLFVYGTLTNDEIVDALVGKNFRKAPARIKNFLVGKLADRNSPGMIEKDGSIAHGFILYDVDDISFNTIKLWENEDYELITVKPEVSEDSVCCTFLWKTKTLAKHWDNDYFRNNHLDWYLEVDIPNFKKKHRL